MTTPEGIVKAKLRELLARYVGLYVYRPVPTGFGKTTLDVIGCYRGFFFIVETKALGKKPTQRQYLELVGAERAMGKTFVIAGPDSPVLGELTAWLDHLTRTVPDDPHFTPDPVHRRAL